MTRFKWVLAAAAVAFCALAVYLHFFGDSRSSLQKSHGAPIQALYIWQRAWNDSVREGLVQATEQASHLMVLAHEEGTSPVNVDWQALANAGLPVTLVFRYPTSLSRELAEGAEGMAQRVLGKVYAIYTTTESHGVRVEGIQLDYDSPTDALGAYRELLRALGGPLRPELNLSITALPTWLEEPAFTLLAESVDYYVLQVHSFERPKSIETPLVLCDTSRIEGYLRQASRVGRPYFIAFPTHGYEVAFDAKGKFIGLSAEGPTPAWPSGTHVREVRADPTAIAAAVNRIACDLPRNFLGTVWFRMPVGLDERNWTWPVLRAVMEGRVPSVHFTVEVRYPEPELAEIWLASVGEDRSERRIDVAVVLPGGAVLASDSVNGFVQIPGGANGEVILRGTSPVEDTASLLGWYRMRDDSAARKVEARVRVRTDG